jgi:uncharacterized protein YbbC (DUF1343 family)
MKFGIDRLLADHALRAPLAGRRVALLAHPASVTEKLTHSLDALVALADVQLTAAFGPQHGLRGDKQDNMVESPDYHDPVHGIPIFSLYGDVRRPTAQMMDSCDVILIDLQDVGCRIYTFITTLLYVLQAAAELGKSIPMRHGLTLGELGHWFIDHFKLNVDYHVVEIEGYRPSAGPGFGWPQDRIWINPSPNAANVNMTRAYAGTVMLEGATLSEGRGTTRPLEIFGAPDIDARAVLAEMHGFAPHWLHGCALREIWFEPTFHKHAGTLCHGVHIHAEGAHYDDNAFKPWRLQALAFKAIRRLYPDYQIWRGTDFKYEYTDDVLAIDVINGGPLLREWVDDAAAQPSDLDAITIADETAWGQERAPYLLY